MEKINEMTKMADGTSRSTVYLDAYQAAIRAIQAGSELDRAADGIDVGDLGDEAAGLLDRAIDAANEHAHERQSDYFEVLVDEVRHRVVEARVDDPNQSAYEAVEAIEWLAKELGALAAEYSSL